MAVNQKKGVVDNIHNALTLRRDVFLAQVFTVAAAVPFLFFSIVNLRYYGNINIGIIEGLLGVAIIVNYIVFYFTHHITPTKYFLIFTVLFGLLTVFVSGGIEKTGIFWLYVFPAAVFAWFGLKRGVHLMLLMLAICLMLIVLYASGIIILPYSVVTLRQFFISLMVLSAVSFWSELARNREELDRKVAERELAERVAEDEAILTNMGDGLIVTDAHLKILLMNSAAEKMLERSAPGTKGKDLSETILICDAKKKSLPIDKTPIGEALAGGSVVSVTTEPYYFTKKYGTIFPVAITASPVVVSKEILGVIIVFRDVTRETEVDRAKTEFVSLASHQLRTPLTAIKWFVNLLLDEGSGVLSDEQRHQLEEVYRGNERMVALVNSLLNVSRLELGTFVVDQESVDIVNVADLTLDELRSQYESKHITIHRVYEKGIRPIYADPKLLQMVFQNLFSNAIKYTPGGGRVAVEIATKERGNMVGGRTLKVDSICLQISDNGYGIPIHQRDKIFTKLFRADNIRRYDTEGNGLGLYIVKSVLEKFGSEIWFESKENEGTTFFVSIPLDRVRVP